MIHFIIFKINRKVPNVFWCWKILSIRAHCPIQVQQLILWGFLYLISCFHLFWKNILSAMYAGWGPPHLSLIVCCIFHLLIPLLIPTDTSSMQNLILQGLQQKSLGTSNQAIYYNLLNIYFSSLIGLDTSIIMSPKTDAPHLWIRR